VKEMSLVEHLEELRKTMISVAIILTVSFFLCYSQGDLISEFLLSPLRSVLKQSHGGQVVYLGLLDKVLSQLQVAFWSSIIISSPFWFYHVWKFIKPGLFEHEIRAVRPFLVVGFFLFVIGVCFGYFLVFPYGFQALMGYGVGDVSAQISLKEYLVLASKILVFLGLLFQLPNVLLILGFMGLVTKYSLREKRRYLYVFFAIAAAVLTPPDVFTMMALWVPLVMLFEVGILGVAFIVHPYLHRRHA